MFENEYKRILKIFKRDLRISKQDLIEKEYSYNDFNLEDNEENYELINSLVFKKFKEIKILSVIYDKINNKFKITILKKEL